MIPSRDENPTQTRSYVTLSLIAINVAVFLYELSLSSADEAQAFFASFAIIPAALSHPASPAAYGTILTSMFLHGGWMHLIGNMWFFWIFGNNIEDSVGHFRFIIFYLLCGVAAALTQVALAPDSEVPMIGASGAISGILGAYMMLFPRARVVTLVPIWFFLQFIRVPAVVFLVVWFGLQFLSGLVSRQFAMTGGVAFWAHVGGFIAGVLLIVPFKKRRVRLFQ